MSNHPFRHAPTPLLAGLVVVALLLSITLPMVAAQDGARAVRLAFIGPADGEAWAGAQQGLVEANAQGKFLGLNFSLLHFDDPRDLEADTTAAVIVDVSALRAVKIAERLPDTAVINTTAEDDELRDGCMANLLHTIPSLAMRDDAIQQWQRKSPQSMATARAWHETFRKYAAAQLNKRYTARTARPMSDAAWAGWAAVRVVSDTAARQQDAEPTGLLEALKGDLAFDGQKGKDLSFRDTGQLRQPLLLVEGGRIVGEAPVRGIVDPGNLDSLGLATCLK